MTEVNKEELRRLADTLNEATEALHQDEANNELGDAWSLADDRFIEICTPAAILSLLDEAEYREEKDARAERNRDMWKAQCDAQAEIIEHMRIENESLRAKLKACHPFRPAQEPTTPVFARGCIICGDLSAHGGLKCPKMRSECTAQEVKR